MEVSLRHILLLSLFLFFPILLSTKCYVYIRVYTLCTVYGLSIPTAVIILGNHIENHVWKIINLFRPRKIAYKNCAALKTHHPDPMRSIDIMYKTREIKYEIKIAFEFRYKCILILFFTFLKHVNEFWLFFCGFRFWVFSFSVWFAFAGELRVEFAALLVSFAISLIWYGSGAQFCTLFMVEDDDDDHHQTVVTRSIST